MNQWQKIKGHLHTINAHKAKVTALCFQCGLYRQGIEHDLSKYSPTELKTGFKYYQGYRSPIDAQKEAEGLSESWLHHKGRNRHHWEYWIDNGPHGVHPVEMPFNYVCEMLCDRIAASMIYQKENYRDDSAWQYYKKSRDHIMMAPRTRKELEFLLKYLAVRGLDPTMQLVRRLLRQYRRTGKVSFPMILFPKSL